MRPVESNPTATLTMELTGPPRKADRGVQGTVVETGPFVSSHHRPWISTMTVGIREAARCCEISQRPSIQNRSKSLDSHIPMPSFTTGGPARQAFGGPDQRHR